MARSKSIKNDVFYLRLHAPLIPEKFHLYFNFVKPAE